MAGSMRQWSRDAVCSPPAVRWIAASQGARAELKMPSGPLVNAVCIIPEESEISEEGVLATLLQEG